DVGQGAVDDDDRVEVSVGGVREGEDPHAGAGADGGNAGDGFRQPGARDDDVLDQDAAEPFQGGQGLTADADERVGLRLAGGTGRRRRVAPTMTPRVPSDPTNRPVRSYPVTPLTVRCPVWIRSPSASTTSSARTESRVTPYFAHRSPPALVAMLPPSVDIST